jgi:hypothetical protein
MYILMLWTHAHTCIYVTHVRIYVHSVDISSTRCRSNKSNHLKIKKNKSIRLHYKIYNAICNFYKRMKEHPFFNLVSYHVNERCFPSSIGAKHSKALALLKDKR